MSPLLTVLSDARQPIARELAVRPGSQPGADAGAWLREMERARMHAAMPQAGAIVPAKLHLGTDAVRAFLAGFGDVKLADPAEVIAASSPSSEMLCAPSESMRAAAPARAPETMTAHPPSSRGETRAQALAGHQFATTWRERGADPADDPHPVTHFVPGQESVVRQSIRVYADWSADGVRIWLGMDANTAVAVQSIATQLQRWLAAQGVRALSIACNGHTFIGDGPASDIPLPHDKERA